MTHVSASPPCSQSIIFLSAAAPHLFTIIRSIWWHGDQYIYGDPTPRSVQAKEILTPLEYFIYAKLWPLTLSAAQASTLRSSQELGRSKHTLSHSSLCWWQSTPIDADLLGLSLRPWAMWHFHIFDLFFGFYHRCFLQCWSPLNQTCPLRSFWDAIIKAEQLFFSMIVCSTYHGSGRPLDSPQNYSFLD